MGENMFQGTDGTEKVYFSHYQDKQANGCVTKGRVMVDIHMK